jgi:hypothetical protein
MTPSLFPLDAVHFWETAGVPQHLVTVVAVVHSGYVVVE